MSRLTQVLLREQREWTSSEREKLLDAVSVQVQTVVDAVKAANLPELKDGWRDLSVTDGRTGKEAKVLIDLGRQRMAVSGTSFHLSGFSPTSTQEQRVLALSHLPMSTLSSMHSALTFLLGG
jgi:hypothetical protein